MRLSLNQKYIIGLKELKMTQSDLGKDLKLMASIIGMSATIKLLTEATGCVFTMTKYWDRELIKRYIKRVYDGTKRSRMNLCILCKVNENYIHKICSEKGK